MKYGLDILEPPTAAWAERVRSAGWTWLNVYVGGPRCAAWRRWQQIDGQRYPVRTVAHVFDGFLPTYVGANAPWDEPSSFTYDRGLLDGDDANAATGACGFAETSPLCLDLEYGTYQAAPGGVLEYVKGWVAKVNLAGHPAGVYSDIDTLNHLLIGELVDFKWGAAWVRGAFTTYAPVGRFDPESPPPWHAWQYANGNLFGINVDTNSMTSDFPLARYEG